MITTLCRTVILYAAVILAMRLMGKRQIGELQPTELVVTILLSEVAAMPLQDPDIPLISSIVSVLLLVSLSIFTSVLTLHNARCREVFEGHPAIVVRDGKPDFKKMKELRMTAQDLLSALRQKDVFELEQVKYAIVETNGTISVLLKDESQPLCQGQAPIPLKEGVLEHLIICDGVVLKKTAADIGLSQTELSNYLKKNQLKPEQVMLLTYGANGFGNLMKKGD